MNIPDLCELQGDSSDCDAILMDWLNGPDIALYQLSQCTVHIPPQTLTESDRHNFTLCFCFEKVLQAQRTFKQVLLSF